MVLLKIIREKNKNTGDRKTVMVPSDCDRRSWVYYKNSYQGFQISLIDNILYFK